MAERGNRRHPTFSIALLAVAALALGIRAANHGDVFRGGEVDLLPSDSHYYVRFALLQLRAFPRFVRFDPLVNFPSGASILWPPVHAWLVALGILAGGRATPEVGAAWVGPALSIAWLVAVAVYARRRFGGGFALAVAFGLAVLPAVVSQGALGNADHHVHEPFLLALAVLTQAELWRTLERRDAVVAGLVLGLGRLLTTVAFVFLVPAALAVLAAALVRRDARVVRRGLELALVSAGTLLLSALLFGEPLALDYERLSAFHPLLAFAAIGSAAVLGECARIVERKRGQAPFPGPPPLRKSSLSPFSPGALVLCGLAALACAVPLIASTASALSHLTRADPLLRVVQESQPLTTFAGWRVYLGVAVLLGPIALGGAVWSLWREHDVRMAPAIAAVLGLGVATALQQRFGRALDGALAVAIPLGLPALVRPLRSPWRPVAGALVGLLALLSIAIAWPSPHREYEEMLARSTLRWLRTHTPAPADVLDPHAPAHSAVVAPFVFGHLILLWGERPAVATAFSQAPWHVRANAEAAAVMSSATDEEAFAKMKALGATYLLATPFNGLLGDFAGDPDSTQIHRLLEGGGFQPAASHFRLLHDSPEQRRRAEGGSFARLFEAVEGARIEGNAAPGADVSASIPVQSNLGVVRSYSVHTRADSRGRFVLRVAYPVGSAEEVHPTEAAYEVRAGPALLGRAAPSVDDVRLGLPVALIRMGAPSPDGVAMDPGGLNR